ncbi:MAG: hypothetical protein Q8Q49_02050 [bacterium]|nr:hypothetical protein [bacterium]
MALSEVGGVLSAQDPSIGHEVADLNRRVDKFHGQIVRGNLFLSQLNIPSMLEWYRAKYNIEDSQLDCPTDISPEKVRHDTQISVQPVASAFRLTWRPKSLEEDRQRSLYVGIANLNRFGAFQVDEGRGETPDINDLHEALLEATFIEFGTFSGRTDVFYSPVLPSQDCFGTPAQLADVTSLVKVRLEGWTGITHVPLKQKVRY